MGQKQKKIHVLIIDDELSICTGIQGILESEGFYAEYSLTPKEGLEYIEKNPNVDIVLLDVNLRSDLNGMDLIPLIKEKNKYIQVIMFTSYNRLDIGLECMKKGAADFLTKPFNEESFKRAASVALEKKHLEQIKDLYFDMVIHDLKNPLQCIYGSVELLYEQLFPSLTPLQKRLMETAKVGINQLQLIIGNVLGITSFEKGNLSSRRENFSVKDTIKDALALYDCVDFFPDENIPETIRSDKDLYLRILLNLVSNAIRFSSPENRIEVRCSYCVEDHTLLTSVLNRGSYIEESQRESIFNKFFGIQKTIGTLRGQNFGLGLTFSKMAVEALEGSIWIESNKETMETYFKFKIKDFTVT